MSVKTILKILLALAIAAFVLLSFNWKKKETETQFKHVRGSKVKSDIVDNQTDRMMQANAQTEGILPPIDRAQVSPSISRSPVFSDNKPEQKMYFVNAGSFFGCTDKTTLHKLLKYSAKGDTKRYEKLFKEGLISGDCTSFRPGEGVYLQETDTQTNEVRINRIKESKTYWTIYETIE